MSGYNNSKTGFTAQNKLWSVAVSKDDKMIAIGDYTSDGKVRVFSINEEINNNNNNNSNKLNFILEKEEKLYSDTVRCLVFSDDDKNLLSCSDDKTIVLCDAKTLKKIKTFNGHTVSVFSALFKSENEIVSCSIDRKIIVWDINSGIQIASVDTRNSCFSLALSPNKDMILVGQGDGNIIVFGATIVNNTLTKITYLPKSHSNWIFFLCFSPNGKMLVSFSHDKTINVYEVISNKSFKHIRTLTGHTGDIYGGAISPDGELIASSSYDNTIKLWDINTGVCVKTITSHNGGVTNVAFSHSGSFLASVGYDKTFQITMNEDALKFRNEKIHVILSLAKSSIFIPFDIRQDYLEFVNSIRLNLIAKIIK